MTTRSPARTRARLCGTVFDAVHERLTRRFVEEAVEIAEEWARFGRTARLISRATRVATSLIAVLGPGNYRILSASRLAEALGRRRSPAPGPVAARAALRRDAAGQRGHPATSSEARMHAGGDQEHRHD
jgi:hypothetical protein